MRNKLVITTLLTMILSSCSNLPQNINIIDSNNTSINSNSVSTKKIKLVENVLPSENTNTLRASKLDKTNKLKNQSVTKKFKSKAKSKSTFKHISLLNTTLNLMKEAKTYKDANKIGRKTAILVIKDLISTNDSDYDMKNIINESLVFARVEEKQPDFYDKYSEKNEYNAITGAFTSIIKDGASEGGHPQNMAIYTYNTVLNIKKDDEIPQEIYYRDGFFMLSFALSLYSEKPEYSDYKDISKNTIKSLDYQNDNIKTLFDKVFRTVDFISG